MDLKFNVCKKDYQSTPIFLPCGWTVCELYLTNSDLKKCVFCHKRHHKNDGSAYPINKPLEIQFNRARLNESIDKASKKLEELKLVQKDPYNFVYDYFGKILNEVHIREANTIESIKSHFDKIIKQIEEVRDRFKPLEQDKLPCVVNLKKENLAVFEKELKALIESTEQSQSSNSIHLDANKKLKDNAKRID
jgi:hypothetical protein